AELQDVRLRGTVNGPSSLGTRVLEGEPRDLLAALVADQLQRLRDAGGLHVLDSRVEILDVLANDHEVDAAAGVRGDDARHFPDGADVRVRLEELAQRDVGALLTEPDRGLERALQRDARTRDRTHRL